MLLSDDRASFGATGRCNDGSDVSLKFPALAEAAVIKRVRGLTAIQPATIHVALKQGADAQPFRFRRPMVVSRTILQLPAWQLALDNISFVVSDDSVAAEDMLIGLRILCHLPIDSRMFLETHYAKLDDINCAPVGNPASGNLVAIGRIIMACAQAVKKSA